MNLTNLFDSSLKGRRDSIGLEFASRAYTFGELDSRSNRLAGALARRGVRAGDRLCVYLVNSVEMVDLYLACVKSGIVFVPINILYRGREISHILGDAEPAALVTDSAIAANVPLWSPAELTAEAESMDDVRPSVALDGDAPAGIIYTSGTTGTSKGAVLTHNNFAANAVNLLACWEITAADRFLLALPLFHVHGLGNGLHAWLMSGCRMRLLERFEHQTATAAFLDFRPTLFFGVPTIYVRLLGTEAGAAKEIGSFMRLFVSGSAPLPAQVHEEFRALFGHTILERYGMSETLMNIGNPYHGERRAGTVGFPFPGVSVRIVEGEIWLRGPNVFAGYWRREEATRAAFTDGWFRTGDIASVSEDGYYTLSGRRSDLIISGGFNIYPREIEEFLQEHPAIAEAAVVGRPDAVRGEVPVAYIVCRETVDVAAIEMHCKASLASFKIPRRFAVLEKLPRNAMGKIQKHLLP
ncbi:MAG: AMP-binding protein [Acidobacteriota bacterium]|nr:AMP-binding protein [Acidobacteriota bacterium]